MKFSRQLILIVFSIGVGACASQMELRSPNSSASVREDASSGKGRARVHTDLAALYFRQQQYGVALEEIKVALTNDRRYAPAWSMLGLLQHALSENDKAEQAFKEALLLAPDDPELQNNWGWFLCQMGREETALQAFRAAYAHPLYTTPAKAHLNMGRCLVRFKRYTEASEQFDVAARLEPSSVSVQTAQVEVLFLTARVADARLKITEILKHPNPGVAAYVLAARIANRLEDYPERDRLLLDLDKKYPNAPELGMLKKEFLIPTS